MRRSSLYIALLAMGVCAWLTWPTLAQQTKRAQPLTDQRFVTLASTDGLAEVDLAKLAMKHGTSQDVKMFARRMIDDHSKVNKELKRLADSKGLHPAMELDKKHRTIADKLAALTGADFDHAYMKDMVSDHKKAVDLFEREAKEGQDPDLRKFAADTLPTLREHLKLAEKITGIKAESTSKGRSGS